MSRDMRFSNNVVCATSKVSDQPAHMRSLIRTFATFLNDQTSLGVSKLKRRLHRVYTCQNAILLEINDTALIADTKTIKPGPSYFLLLRVQKEVHMMWN